MVESQSIPLSFLWRYSSRVGNICNYHFWFLVCPGVPLALSDCRILWWLKCMEESIYILDYLNGDNYQKKFASKITSFGWMWPGVFLFQSASRILLSTKPIKKSVDINWYWNNHEEKIAPRIINFCQRWPVKLLAKLDWRFHQDHRVLWKRSVGIFVFGMDFVIKGSLDDFAALLPGADLLQYLASIYFIFFI